jgi:hypothetical protein
MGVDKREFPCFLDTRCPVLNFGHDRASSLHFRDQIFLRYRNALCPRGMYSSKTLTTGTTEHKLQLVDKLATSLLRTHLVDKL